MCARVGMRARIAAATLDQSQSPVFARCNVVQRRRTRRSHKNLSNVLFNDINDAIGRRTERIKGLLVDRALQLYL